MSNCAEIAGIYKIALYVNKFIRYNRPDVSIEDVVDFIVHARGSVIVNQENKPTWSREISYSENYKPIYSDTFTFFLDGINNDTPEILQAIRSNRNGYILELITIDNRSLVFPTPVFISKNSIKEVNSRNWQIELKYREPTFNNYLDKNNTLLQTNNYLSFGSVGLFGVGLNTVLVENFNT